MLAHEFFYRGTGYNTDIFYVGIKLFNHLIFCTPSHEVFIHLRPIKIIHVVLIIEIYLIAINKVTLLGRVGADPQKRGTEEHPVVVFSLATHQNFINNNEGCIFLFYYSFEHIVIVV